MRGETPILSREDDKLPSVVYESSFASPIPGSIVASPGFTMRRRLLPGLVYTYGVPSRRIQSSSAGPIFHRLKCSQIGMVRSGQAYLVASVDARAPH